MKILLAALTCGSDVDKNMVSQQVLTFKRRHLNLQHTGWWPDFLNTFNV
jgi:hypothetical protein